MGETRLARLLAGLLMALSASHAAQAAGEWHGELAIEARHFSDPPPHSADWSDGASLALDLEYYERIGDRHSLVVSPFVRLDQRDQQRSHADLREAFWHYYADEFELRAGIGQVFWGVTESRHLVDVINQTDFVESSDGEDKLGQPMLQLILPTDIGNLELFWLPYFRERTFAGVDGRPRPALPVAVDEPVYQSGRGPRHWDFAARYSHSFGIWDLGLSQFTGTARAPRLVPTFDAASASLKLVPHYDLVSRSGIDLQATIDAWLWKLEAVHQRAALRQDHSEAVAGVEYTFFDMRGSGADLGLIVEYLYDQRGADADQPFQDDLMLGLRLALNDVQSSQALFGVIADLDGGGHSLALEASRRLGDDFTLDFEMRASENVDPAEDPQLAPFSHTDFARLQLSWYF